jgi:Protein of unknown function (DUF3485)
VSGALPKLIAFVAVVIAAVVPGLWGHRWVSSSVLADATARLTLMPMTVGDWEGRDLEINPRELRVAQADGYVQRRYVHRHTGETVTILALCGRPGPISVHTPEVCYAGVGYEELGTVTRREVAGLDGDRFWYRRFQKTGPTPTSLGITYAWTASGAWEAVDNPRLALARHPVVFKLYVVRSLSDPKEPSDADPTMDFLRALVPPLRAALFPPV